MNVQIGIHQPNYFPWLGYFYKIKSSNKFVFLDTVDIQLGSASSITNRTYIKTKHGRQWLTVPIIKGTNKKINEVLIDNKQPWRKKQLNTLFHAYHKAPFFEEGFNSIEKLILSDFENLADFNIACIQQVCRKLKITTLLKRVSTLDIQENDKNQRLIAICKKLKGNIYLSGEGAKNYNDDGLFKSSMIELKYINFVPHEYPQLNGAFINGLSIIDALFNCGSDIKSLI